MSNCILAHTWDEKKQSPVGWYMSEKLDGVRAIWNGEYLLTRNGNIIHAPDKWLAELPEHQQLDGELFMGRGQFQKTVSVTRRLTPDKEDWMRVGYMVFDVIDMNVDWLERFTQLKLGYPIVPVEHHLCHSLEHLDTYYRSIIDNGGEGVMIRNPRGMYVKQRSHDLLKVKPSLHMEAVVTGYTEGKGKYEGMVGALECKAGDVTFEVGSGLTDADRTRKYTPMIGTKIKVIYQSLTDDGKPRFPRYNGKI